MIKLFDKIDYLLEQYYILYVICYILYVKAIFLLHVEVI